MQGQELRVWYSPFYADRMGVQILSNQSDLPPHLDDLDEEFQEIFSSVSKNFQIITLSLYIKANIV